MDLSWFQRAFAFIENPTSYDSLSAVGIRQLYSRRCHCDNRQAMPDARVSVTMRA